jgi:hypothetical protein
MPYFSGTINYCLCNPKAEGEETKESDVFSIEPNPSNGSFRVLLQLPITIDESCRLQVLDLTGKIVYKDIVRIENDLFEKQISLSHIASGFYFIKIISGEKVFQSKLMINE